MSQGQPRKPQAGEGQQQDKPIKYGDVFPVSGDLAKQPVAPKDAAMMQAAETTMLGQTQKRGPAAAMQSAATANERAGFVGHGDVTDAAKHGGVTVAETEVPGTRIITETVAGQVVGQYLEPKTGGGGGARKTASTIGEALEAAAQTAGDKAVDHSDAAAIQAAECRVTGSSIITPGGLAAAAQSAAAYNDGFIGNDGKVKLRDILTGAKAKLGADKVATREDAEGIMSAEVRNDADMKVHAGGVAESVAAAATRNEKGLAVAESVAAAVKKNEEGLAK